MKKRRIYLNQFLKRKGMLILLMLFSVSYISSQTTETLAGNIVKGKLIDEKGEVIIGAKISTKNTKVFTVTDIDGNFSLKIDKGDIIVCTYVGYATNEIPYNGESTITITLKENTEELDEVVVVGYGSQKKVNMTGAVSQISNKELKNRPIQNISSAMQGLMPGVTVTSTDGRPGRDGGKIRIRGTGTLNEADPYILIDGVESGSIDSVDPNDIESISVLKDAASAAIYGSKASNGVILVTTKRGKSGKARITYSGYVGAQLPTNLVKRLSSYDYASLLVQAQRNEGVQPTFNEEQLSKFKAGNDPDYPNTDWYGLAYKTGLQHSHNININGGTDDVKYTTSVGFLSQDGILAHSQRRQFNGRTNLDIRCTDRLDVKMNLSYINNQYADPISTVERSGSDQIIRQLNLIAPWIVARYDNGTYGTISDGNPIAWLDLDQTLDRKNQNFTGIVSANYSILPELKASLTGAYTGFQQHYKNFRKFIQYNDYKSSEPNSLDERHYGWSQKNFDALLDYDKSFASNNIKVMTGWHAERYKYTYNKELRFNFPNNDLDDMNAGDASTQTNEGFTRELAMISWFGRINYDYAGKYLFEANFRADASSRFAKNHRWGYFPSFSGAWRLSEEEFMTASKDWLTNLKIRMSWGLLGNQSALDDFYPAITTYNVKVNYPFGGVLNPGYSQRYFKKESISWEKARTWGIGLDFTINNNITGTIDYYDRKTTDILMKIAVPAEFALEPYIDNVGAMVNKGVEMVLNYNLKRNDWSLGLTGNFAYNNNKLLELGETGQGNWMPDPDNENMRRAIGKPIDTYYVYKADGFFESDKAAQEWMDKYKNKPGYPFGNQRFKGGDLIYQDTNNDGLITVDDKQYRGSTNPVYTFGLNINSSYKNFDLSMIFNGAAGGARIYNDEVFGDFRGDNSHPSTIWLNAWSEENKNAKMPRIATQLNSPSHPKNVMSTFWLFDTSYIRLKNIQLGYTVSPKNAQKMGVQNIRLYYSAENVFTIHSLPVNIDPETERERGSSYPILQTHSFGVNITF